MSDLPLSPLLDIESNLSPLPDRLRLLAAAGLTEPAFYRTLKSPNNYRRHRRLCCAPHGKKCGFFCSCHQSASEGCGYILARRRPVSVRTGGCSWPGSVALPFLYPVGSLSSLDFPPSCG